MTAPRPVTSPLGRVVDSHPPTTEQTRLAAARAWHEFGAVVIHPADLERLTPVHRSFLERIVEGLYGQRSQA